MPAYSDTNRIQIPLQFKEHFSNALGSEMPEESFTLDVEAESALRRTRNYLRRSGELIQAIEDFRVANLKDETQTEVGAAVSTYKYAEAKLDEIRDMMVSVEPGDLADRIEEAVQGALKEAATKSARGREYRDKIEAAGENGRSQVSKWIRNGERKKAEFILGEDPFLSGLTENQFNDLRNRFIKKYFENELKAVEVLRRVDEHRFKGYEKAEQIVRGLKTPKVKEALKQQEAVQKAKEA
jgi:hypothetical protein